MNRGTSPGPWVEISQIEQRMKDSVDEFLRSVGSSAAAIARHVDELHGGASLMTIGGSLAHGFGNPTSDIDLYLIADHDTERRHPSAGKIGIELLLGPWAERVGARLSSGGYLEKGLLDRGAWQRAIRILTTFFRIPFGVPISGRPDWLEWRRRLLSPELVEVMVRFWELEASRRWVVARVAGAIRPQLAALRAADAVMAALDARATRAGEVYFGTKWLGAKLSRLGDPHKIDTYRRALCFRGDYGREAEDTLRELLPEHCWPERVELVLSGAPGTASHRMGQRALVHRWRLRAREVRPNLEVRAGQEFWRGPLGGLPPDERGLLLEDFAWLGITFGGQS